jgi:ParB/RepB/Spo0J family partition protein
MGLDIKDIPLDTLYISPRNVRQDSGDLSELIASIRDMGILEPILVRQMGEMYEVIAGRRRLEAARIIGLKTIPASVLDVTDLQAIIVSLIENVQRKDLTLAERVETYQLLRQLDAAYQNHHNLAKVTGFSHQKISQDFQADAIRLKLAPHGIRVSSHLPTSAVERQQGSLLPEYHAVLIRQAMDSLVENGAVPEEAADEKMVELAQLIALLSQDAAKELIEQVKDRPESLHGRDNQQQGEPIIRLAQPPSHSHGDSSRRKPTVKRGEDGGGVTCTCCGQALSLIHRKNGSHQVKRQFIHLVNQQELPGLFS